MTARTAAAAGARCSPVAIGPKRIVTTCAASRSRKHEPKPVLLNIVAAGVERPMSKAGLLAEHRALSLPRRPHRAAACSQPIAVVAFGFWVTPFEFRVRKFIFRC